MLLYDGVCFQILSVLTSGAFLVAFALLLGASNLVIGIIAAVGPLTQILQIPGIFFIEKIGMRKAVVFMNSVIGRLFWVVVALTPWFLPPPYRIPVVLASILLYFGLGAVSNLAFGSWMQDVVPEDIRGRYFGKRAAISTALGAALSLLAGISVDYFAQQFPEIGIYSAFFLIASAIGLIGTYFISRVPEPRMVATPQQSIRAVLTEPFHDENFRQLLRFLGSWNFAINLAAPFFTVYMLQRLQLSMTIVLALSVLSQLMNVLFFQLWGRLADRFSNKSVLAVAGPLFMLSIFFFPLTTMPEAYVLTLPFLVLIHVLAGISMAGMLLCAGNIALKLAPQGKATAYLATNALVSGMAAAIAPILGGIAADWFAKKELRLALTWTSERIHEGMELPAMNLRGLDFLFILACVLGMYSLHRLVLVKEAGDVEEGVVVSEFYRMMRKAVRSVSNVAGMRLLFSFPYGRLTELFSEDNLMQDDESGLPMSPGLFHAASITNEFDLNDDHKRER